MGDCSDYRQFWNEFRIRCNQQEMHRHFFSERKEEFGFCDVKSFISIGAGCGEIDTHVIKECMPNLKTYIGVEPNDDNRDSLIKNLNTCPGVQTTILKEKMPGWTGPEQKVDVIFALHVLYYFPDVGATLKQLLSWLNPGGKLILGHGCDDYPLARLLQKMYPEIAQKEYWYQELQEDLLRSGLSEYDEYAVDCKLLTHDFYATNPLVKEMMTQALTNLNGEKRLIYQKRAAEVLSELGDSVPMKNMILCIRKKKL